MTTVVTKSVGSTGRDYSTLTAAFAAIPSNLVTADEQWILELYNDSEFVGAGGITLSGKTTDATRNIIIRPATGQGRKHSASKATDKIAYDQSKGVGIRFDSGFQAVGLTISVAYTLLDGIQFKSAYDGLSSLVLLNATGCLGVGLLGDSVSSAAGTNGQFRSASGAKYINSVVIDRSAESIGFMSMGGTATFANCTAISLTGSSRRAFDTNYDSPIAKNCVAVGFATGFGTGNGGWAASSTNNASSDASAPGSNYHRNITASAAFVDVTNTSALDLRPKVGGILINNGTRDQTHTADLDLLAVSRSTTTPTIGAVEYVAAGGGGDTISCTVGNCVTAGVTAAILASVTIAGNVGNAVAAGSTASIQTGSAVTISATVGNAVAAGSTATITASGTGTLTTEPLKNNTGTLLASQTGATAFVYNTSTGALIVAKTGQTTDASGIMTITDALIAPATQYRVVVVLGSGAEGMAKITAS